MEHDDQYWDDFFREASAALARVGAKVPAVSVVERERRSPFSVLVSTLLSLRTKDQVTLDASRRLLALADTPQRMLALTQEEIEKAIFPVGFYHTKAANLLRISRALIERHGGQVPSTTEELLSLPGVGIKTANLTLNLGFGIDAICVDCHVHQISNRLGWIRTRTPEESEKALQTVMPRRLWIPLNELLVTYGQNICLSVSPRCGICPFNGACPRIGVVRSR